jgi:hypothetical protein
MEDAWRCRDDMLIFCTHIEHSNVEIGTMDIYEADEEELEKSIPNDNNIEVGEGTARLIMEVTTTLK